MYQVGVVHVDDSRDVTFQFGDGACEVGAVPFLLVGADDTYANYSPSRWRGAISLA